MRELELIQRFKTDPEAAYLEMLERYTPDLLRMIRHLMPEDTDEVMEVYTGICERLCANHYLVLRRLRSCDTLTPWLSIVVANACRDRFRKKKTLSVPKSVLAQLDERERLVFKYYYQEHLAHEDISEIINCRHRVPYTALEVVCAIGKINDLLTANKRWILLSALRANRPFLSLDELKESGFQPSVYDNIDDFDELLRRQDMLDRLNNALQQLDVEDKLLVLFRFEHGRSATQIARIMQYDNHKYVYSRLRTIVKRLKKKIGIDTLPQHRRS